uniref:Antistasin-like domain-containing protein n=1 Tax=Megaselia scalaris TaxID=36166 RepID=T1H330_MEGSC
MFTKICIVLLLANCFGNYVQTNKTTLCGTYIEECKTNSSPGWPLIKICYEDTNCSTCRCPILPYCPNDSLEKCCKSRSPECKCTCPRYCASEEENKYCCIADTTIPPNFNCECICLLGIQPFFSPNTLKSAAGK